MRTVPVVKNAKVRAKVDKNWFPILGPEITIDSEVVDRNLYLGDSGNEMDFNNPVHAWSEATHSLHHNDIQKDSVKDILLTVKMRKASWSRALVVHEATHLAIGAVMIMGYKWKEVNSDGKYVELIPELIEEITELIIHLHTGVPIQRYEDIE